MSGATIKTAVAQLLTANIPSLARVTKEPEWITIGAASPIVMLWDRSYREAPLTNHSNQRTYRLLTEVVVIGSDPEEDQPAFDALLEEIDALYRAHPTLDGLADTATSRVLNFHRKVDFERTRLWGDQARTVRRASFTSDVDEIVDP